VPGLGLHAHDELLAFVNTLVRTFPRKPRHAVLENSSTRSTQVKRQARTTCTHDP
jgi:hypothetical protein